MSQDEKRRRAAKKGAATRAANKAMLDRWLTVDKPAQERMTPFLNHLLSCGTFDMRWNPLGDSERKLMRGVTKGRLIKFLDGGRMLRIKPDGYKKAMDFHPLFWEPIF